MSLLGSGTAGFPKMVKAGVGIPGFGRVEVPGHLACRWIRAYFLAQATQ